MSMTEAAEIVAQRYQISRVAQDEYPENASHLSYGAAAVGLMERSRAERRGLEPLGACRGLAVAGCALDEMGIGPVYAIPKPFEKHDLTVDDIDHCELDEAFASQVLYCRDRLGIPNEKLNVSGRAIWIGHSYGMSGARMTGHILHEGRRCNARLGCRHHAHERRHGRRWAVRNLLTTFAHDV